VRAVDDCPAATATHLGIWTEAADELPRHTCGRCNNLVDECSACHWRGDVRVGTPCQKCGGQVLWRRCRQWPLRGTTVCGKHGGSAPQIVAAAERRSIDNDIAGRVGDVIDRYTDTPATHPIEGLLEAVRRSGAMMRAATHFAGELDDPVAWTGGDQPRKIIHPLLEFAHRVTVDHARLTKIALDAGIDERRLKLDQADTDQLFEAVLTASGHPAVAMTVTQREAFLTALGVALRGPTLPGEVTDG
jgi:hypothetical protein